MQAILWAQKLSSGFADLFFNLATQLGETLPVLVLMCVILWAVNEKKAWRIAFSLVLAVTLCTALKNIFRIERPWVLFGDAIRVIRQETATGYSFPSGHTATATAVFMALGLSCRRKWWLIPCAAASLLVAFSRLYCGVHKLLDVSVGLAVGLTGAVLSKYLLSFLLKGRNAFIMVPISLALSASLFFVRDADLAKILGGFFALSLGFYLDTRMALKSRELNVMQKVIKTVTGLAMIIGVYLSLKFLFALIGDYIILHYIRYFVVGICATFVVNWFWDGVLGKKAPPKGYDAEKSSYN